MRGGVWEGLPIPPPAVGAPEPYTFPAARAHAPGGRVRVHGLPHHPVLRRPGRPNPWLQEFPDPITQVTWGGWVEISTADADRMRTEARRHAPARPHRTAASNFRPCPSTRCRPGRSPPRSGRATRSAAMPPGSRPTRCSSSRPRSTRRPGTCAGRRPQVTVSRLDARFPVAHTDGSFFRNNRDLYENLTLTGLPQGGRLRGAAAHRPPDPGRVRAPQGHLPRAHPRGLPLGHGGRPGPLHRLRGLRDGLLRREQRRGRRAQAHAAWAARCPGSGSSATSTRTRRTAPTGCSCSASTATTRPASRSARSSRRTTPRRA